jgi:hypothetical protein
MKTTPFIITPKRIKILEINFIMEVKNWAPVTHTYNPSYSGDRDQEDLSLKPAQANSSGDPISPKKKNQGR